MSAGHSHRPTLKQQNKPFKSKHSTKSSLKDASKGRVLHPSKRPSPKASPSTNGAAAQATRLNRRNTARQTQARKRGSIVEATRVFSGVDGAPRVVAVVPLCDDDKTVDALGAVSMLVAALGEEGQDVVLGENGLVRIRAARFKTSLQFMPLPCRSLYQALDAAKVADYILFLLSPTVEVDQWGDTLLRILQAQGMPHVVSLVLPTTLASSSMPSSSSSSSHSKSERQVIMKSLLSFMQYFVPSQTRVYDLESNSDRLQAVRALSEGRPGEVKWREGRSWMLGEDISWSPSASQSAGGEGELTVTGVVRGIGLSPNRLVHLPNWGDYQISKIVSAPLPRPSRSGISAADVMQIESTLLGEPDSDLADSLVSSNDPDDMANEQTWPTEDEMNAQGHGAVDAEDDEVPDAMDGTTPKRIKKLPKGTSEYQAAWILDDEGDEDGEDEGVDVNEDTDMHETEGEVLDVDVEEEEEDMDMDAISTRAGKSVHFQDLPAEDDAAQLRSWRSRARTEEESTDLQFPDEIDTPQDVDARTRFQRYRGMRSFRTSPWDPYENLPRDYARIFQFEDFKRTERGVMRRAYEDGGAIEPGNRVTVCLKNVPKEAAERLAISAPITLFQLFQHEHKKSVLHFTVQRNTEYDGSVKSKDPLILCVGPRRLRINPVYSQHTRGGGKGANNVHKFERFLKHGITTVATIYGPVPFGKQSCALLREGGDSQAPELVAMGSFLNTDTTRIIAKRIILTGHPFKVHKKTATVRYMFFNSDDVHYYKPIALSTKHGRTGHIKESLGTHGYFKAHFDGPVNQMDTVSMSLYKRVYPKWGEIFVASAIPSHSVAKAEDGDVRMEDYVESYIDGTEEIKSSTSSTFTEQLIKSVASS